MSKVDLHIHSAASDGRVSPEDVVRKSAESGLTVIAITDHDTVDGIVPALVAAEAFPWLKVIPGVEISRLVNLAVKYGLIASGGSNCHGLDVSSETMIGGVDVPIKSAEQLMALAEQRVLKGVS